MKTSETKSKSKKTDKGKVQSDNKKSILRKSEPSEEEIREKANEIYQQRIDRGEFGTAEEDWIEAEKYLNDLKD